MLLRKAAWGLNLPQVADKTRPPGKENPWRGRAPPMKIHKVLLLAFAALLVAFHPARATVPSQTGFLQYTLTTNPQALPVTFVFQNAGDLLVLDTRAPAGPVTLTLNSDYAVTGGSGSTGTLNTVAGGANGVQVGDVISILRQVPLTQTTSFTNTGPLTAAMIGQSLDKLTEVTQQLNVRSLGSLRFPPDEVRDGTLNKAARSGNVVGFDSSGNLTYYAFVAGAVLPQSIQGTQNQVLANGSFGSPVTGAVILTTPQNIGTGSTVQFGKIGINGAAVGNSDLTVTRALPAVTAQASVVVSGSLSPPPATDLHPNAFRDMTAFTPTQPADGYASFDVQTSMGGTVALNHYRGFQVRHAYTGTNTLGEMSGFMTANMGVSGPGTVTFLRGLYVSNPSLSGGGSIGQFDGIYMDQLSTGTSVHAIYIAGNNNIFMAGGQIATSDLLTPINTQNRLDVTFDQTTQYGIGIRNKNAAATGYMIQFYNNNPTQQGSIQQANSTTVAFNTTSDARLKENVRSLTDSGVILDAMQPRTFDWRWGGKDYHGFVAQELYKVYPEAVSKGDDDPDKIKEPWSVDYSKLTPVLVAEAKDLRRRVRNLEFSVLALFVLFTGQAILTARKTNRR